MLFGIDEHLGEHLTRELCGERVRDCMCSGGGNDVVLCFSAELVNGMLEMWEDIDYEEREHVFQGAESFLVNISWTLRMQACRRV